MRPHDFQIGNQFGPTLSPFQENIQYNWPQPNNLQRSPPSIPFDNSSHMPSPSMFFNQYSSQPEQLSLSLPPSTQPVNALPNFAGDANPQFQSSNMPPSSLQFSLEGFNSFRPQMGQFQLQFQTPTFQFQMKRNQQWKQAQDQFLAPPPINSYVPSMVHTSFGSQQFPNPQFHNHLDQSMFHNYYYQNNVLRQHLVSDKVQPPPSRLPESPIHNTPEKSSSLVSSLPVTSPLVSITCSVMNDSSVIPSRASQKQHLTPSRPIPRVIPPSALPGVKLPPIISLTSSVNLQDNPLRKTQLPIIEGAKPSKKIAQVQRITKLDDSCGRFFIKIACHSNIVCEWFQQQDLWMLKFGVDQFIIQMKLVRSMLHLFALKGSLIKPFDPGIRFYSKNQEDGFSEYASPMYRASQCSSSAQILFTDPN